MKKLIFALSLLLGATVYAQTTADVFGRLPILSSNDVSPMMVSSHAPHQQNGDKYYVLYTDDNGDKVVFDVKGSGCVTGLWGTVLDPNGIIKFYFDGEETPSIETNIIEFFKGNYPGFEAPLNSYERKGYFISDSYGANSFYPIPFEKSLRIAVQGEVGFYHVMYETYPQGKFPGKDFFDNRTAEIKSIFNWEQSVPDDAPGIGERSGESIRPKGSAKILSRGNSGCIRKIEIEVPDDPEILKDVWIQMFWDEEEVRKDSNYVVYERNLDNRFANAYAPIGMFFGSPDEFIDLESLPISMKRLSNGRVRMSCRFSMPYWRNARILLLNKSDKKEYKDIDTKIYFGANPYDEDKTAYFGATYRQGKTEYANDWIFARLRGQGKFLGVVHTLQYDHYCEGNEHFHIDGNRTPQINGTGTEDYYLGCFWPSVPFRMPIAGAVNDVRVLGGGVQTRERQCLPQDYLNPAVYYRFHIEMPMSFHTGIDALIQQGADNRITSSYRSLAFYYLKRTPSMYQTDFLDLGSRESRRQHSYRSRGVETELTARYEGDDYLTGYFDKGYEHVNGETVRFRLAVNPENDGVLLRRRLDQIKGRQEADVYVNGKFAGTWYTPHSNEILRWADDEFNIPAELTKGRKALRIKLRVKGDYNDYEYLCYSK